MKILLLLLLLTNQDDFDFEKAKEESLIQLEQPKQTEGPRAEQSKPTKEPKVKEPDGTIYYLYPNFNCPACKRHKIDLQKGKFKSIRFKPGRDPNGYWTTFPVFYWKAIDGTDRSMPGYSDPDTLINYYKKTRRWRRAN